MIELNGVSAGYGGTPVVHNVALRIAEGGYVGIIGPSGAGKTTLLRTILGATPHVHGEVRVAGRHVRPGRPPAGVGYVPQVSTVDWTFPVTVADVARMGLSASGNWLPWPNREQRRRVAAVLERLGIGGLAKRQIQELSGGQQRRVFLARALVGQPWLLCLDEPTASLDFATRDTILRLLGELHAEGTTIVLTTHELSGIVTQLPWVVCVNGGIIAQGAPDDVLTGPILSKTYGVPLHVVRDPVAGVTLVGEVLASSSIADVTPPLSLLARARQQGSAA